ncbi:hypothetical protein [Kribbella sp. NPDC023855]|uniref:hypothetical protein n=1 Tax=Kribbella sp. NPDC023855 TaxID=3154698 RepID=UPI003406F922
MTYLIATVDNQSDDTINMYKVVVVTNDGRQIEATSVSDYVDRWREAFAGEGGDSAKYLRGIELSNKSQFYLLPGAKGTAILATGDPIPSVSGSSSTRRGCSAVWKRIEPVSLMFPVMSAVSGSDNVGVGPSLSK